MEEAFFEKSHHLVVISDLYKQQLTANGSVIGEYHKCGDEQLCLLKSSGAKTARISLSDKNVWVRFFFLVV